MIHPIHFKTLAAAACLTFATMTSSWAVPVTLNVDQSGQLFGASNVNVDGNIFNVEFLEGSCVSLFTGCDNPSDFDFGDQIGAVAAAQALLDSVIINGPLGNFDNDPSLTRGLNVFDVGSIRIPYQRNLGFNFLLASANNREPSFGADDVTLGSGDPRTNLTAFSRFTYAKFTQISVSAVPLPAALPLMGAGFAALGFMGWRRKRKAA